MEVKNEEPKNEKLDLKLGKPAFSSDEDEWTDLANKTKETIKSFDELFNSENATEKSDKKVQENNEDKSKDVVKA